MSRLNAEPGPSRLRGLSISGSSATSSSASPINPVDELDEQYVHAHAQQQHHLYQQQQQQQYGQSFGHNQALGQGQHGQGKGPGVGQNQGQAYAQLPQGTGGQGQAQGQGQGQGQNQSQSVAGINRNGLRVGEDGEVTRVPAFLTKLFSMVSDKETDGLIYWSPNGDSFLIPNHEQFSQNILPRFFKHKNFSSFVRQLNMYAFHKVPHLQSNNTAESSPEIWEFVNPLFKRNQPELLGRISRRQRGNVPAPAPTRTSARQQASTPTGSGQGQGQGGTVYGANGQPLHLITDGSIEGDASIGFGLGADGGSAGGNGSGNFGSGAGSNGQMILGPQGMIDLAAITSGIKAIQRTQASIGADLKALQTSNEHLWREAMEQREKHKKHQETIDLIVSFLERLFGTDGEGLKGLKEAMRRSGLARARDGDDLMGMGMGSEGGKKRRRLGLDRMIGDGRTEPSSTGSAGGMGANAASASGTGGTVGAGTGGQGHLFEISSDSSRPLARTHSHAFTPRLSRNRSSRASSHVDLDLGDDWQTSNRFTTLPNDEPSPGTSNGGAAGTGAGGSGSASTSKAPSPPSPAPPSGTIRPSAMHGGSGSGAGNVGGTGTVNAGAGGNVNAFGTSLNDTDDLFGNAGALAPYNYNTNNAFSTLNSGMPNAFSSGAADPSLPSNPSAMSNANLHSLALMSPSTAQSAAAAFNLDPSILQTTIGSLLQSPAAAQMFLSSLNNSVQGQSLTPMRGVFSPGLQNANLQGQVPGMGGKGQATGPYGYGGSGATMLNGGQGAGTGAAGGSGNDGQNQGGYFGQPFSPGADFTNAALGDFGGSSGQSGNVGSGVGSASSSGADPGQMSMYDDPTLALLSPLPMPSLSHEALVDNQNHLMRTYEDAAAMEGDMDKLQESIDQLVRSMGLDVGANGAGVGQVSGSGQGQGQQQDIETPSQAQGRSKGYDVPDIKVEPLDTTPSNTATATPLTGQLGSARSNPATGSSDSIRGGQFGAAPPDGMIPSDIDLAALGTLDGDLDFNVPEGFDMDAFLNDMAAEDADGGMGVSGTGAASG